MSASGVKGWGVFYTSLREQQERSGADPVLGPGTPSDWVQRRRWVFWKQTQRLEFAGGAVCSSPPGPFPVPPARRGLWEASRAGCLLQLLPHDFDYGILSFMA